MDQKELNEQVREYMRGIGKSGGDARAKNLSKEELSDIGKMGGRPKNPETKSKSEKSV